MTDAGSGAVLLVGAGKMGGALLNGWIGRGWAPQLTVVDPNLPEALRRHAGLHGFTVTDTVAGLAPHDVIVLAIKPQMLDAVAPALRPLCGPGTLLISILAGKTETDLAARLPAGAIVRAMPNTPAAVSHGITGAYAGPKVGGGHRVRAEALLGAVGEVEWLADELLIDAVTAVSGSGPAYVFLMVEALAAAACSIGLEAGQADRLARATVIGAGALLDAEPGTGAGQLRRNVTSPGGTTAAALAVLQGDEALAELIRKAVEAARDRARALAG